MAIDRSTANYEQEQERREALQDNRAYWTEDVVPTPIEQPIPAVCAQCVNWRPLAGQLHLADGTTSLSPGFCTTRTAANLPQMFQDYAQNCSLFEEDIPF